MTANPHDCCTPGTGANGGRYDLVIIGAGSVGFSAAITAAELDARVALVGHGTIGGTCVNTGCVPSKNLIRATEALHGAAVAGRFGGIRAQARVEDWRVVKRGKDALVSSLRQAKYIDLLRAYNTVAYFEGWARFSDGGVAVDGKLVDAGEVIITTGASPALPPILGIERVPHLTSTTALELDQLPQSLLVIGGGYIGCELGQMFARAGVAVTIIDIVPILSTGEPEISTALAGYLRAEGIVRREGVRPTAIRETARGVALDMSAGRESEMLEAEQVLVTTGRRPNTAGLGLDEAGIELLENGGVKVDDHMRTTRAGVYAAGDVTGRDQFVYMAAYGARIAAENALGGNGKSYDVTAMPSVVFTDPQVASVGLTEAQAREQGIPVKTAVYRSIKCLVRSPRARPAGSSSSSPKWEAAGSSARTCWRPRVPTASKRRRSRSKAGSRSKSWPRRSSPI
jgi:mercuric reductase